MSELRLLQSERPPFIFCESIWATGSSPWHLRRLGPEGLKPGGGIDTSSLCGRVHAWEGWDLLVRITDHHLSHACPRCVDIYRKETPTT